METVIVEVTQSDILGGAFNDGLRCPIARALGRAIGEPVKVGAYYWLTVKDWMEGQGKRTHMLSAKAQRWIADYDRRKSVRPFQFRTPSPKATTRREMSA